eukprot:1234793-Rhodomonas_salina.1
MRARVTCNNTITCGSNAITGSARPERQRDRRGGGAAACGVASALQVPAYAHASGVRTAALAAYGATDMCGTGAAYDATDTCDRNPTDVAYDMMLQPSGAHRPEPQPD